MNEEVDIIQEELTPITCELLDLVDNLKKKTKESMVSGERSILKGIAIFEEVVKEINPAVMDENVMSMIISYTSIVMFKEEEERGHVDSRAHYGINQCYMMMDIYNKRKKRELVKNA